jgi:uncharacterized protein (DUF488 family)
VAHIFTIGFTKKSLKDFIELLKSAGVHTLIDVRLRNTSQLAGWSKYPDFAYLLETGFGIRYEHHPEFAPTDELLDTYKKAGDWQWYEEKFNHLLTARQLTEAGQTLLEKDNICLLCAEPTADKCHRRLVADYLVRLNTDSTITHL